MKSALFNSISKKMIDILPILAVVIGVYQFSYQQGKETNRLVLSDFSTAVNELFTTKESKISSVTTIVASMSKDTDLRDRGHAIISSYIKGRYPIFFSNDLKMMSDSKVNKVEDCKINWNYVKDAGSINYILQYLVSSNVFDDIDSYYQDITTFYGMRIYGKGATISQPIEVNASKMSDITIDSAWSHIHCSEFYNSSISINDSRGDLYIDSSGLYNSTVNGGVINNVYASKSKFNGDGLIKNSIISIGELATSEISHSIIGGVKINLSREARLLDSTISDSIIIADNDSLGIDSFIKRNTINNSVICLKNPAILNTISNKMDKDTKIFKYSQKCPKTLSNGQKPENTTFTFNLKSIVDSINEL